MNNYYTLHELARINVASLQKEGQAAQLFNRARGRRHSTPGLSRLRISGLLISMENALKTRPAAQSNSVRISSSQSPECC